MTSHSSLIETMHLSGTTLASSALTLLTGCREGHLARKNLTYVLLAWLFSGANSK